jgi:hypothetical protein
MNNFLSVVSIYTDGYKNKKNGNIQWTKVRITVIFKYYLLFSFKLPNLKLRALKPFSQKLRIFLKESKLWSNIFYHFEKLKSCIFQKHLVLEAKS